MVQAVRLPQFFYRLSSITHTPFPPHTQPFFGSLDFVWDNLGIKRNIHPLKPKLIINHPLHASSIHCDQWHRLRTIYVPDSLFAQSLSKFSSVYLLVWHRPSHTPYISMPVWHSGSIVRRKNEVTLRWARLVLGWVIVVGRVYHLGM